MRAKLTKVNGNDLDAEVGVVKISTRPVQTSQTQVTQASGSRMPPEDIWRLSSTMVRREQNNLNSLQHCFTKTRHAKWKRPTQLWQLRMLIRPSFCLKTRNEFSKECKNIEMVDPLMIQRCILFRTFPGFCRPKSLF